MGWILIGTKTTDSNGEVIFDNLPYGNYQYKQTSAKTGYTADPTEYEVTIDSATPVQATRSNTPAETGSIKIDKYSVGYPTMKLAGAKFSLKDAADKALVSESAETSATGELLFENIMTIDGTPQNYKIQEVTPPTGYDLNTTEFPVSVELSSETVQEVTNTPTEAGQIDVALTDTNYLEYGLDGIDYGIYMDDGL